MTKIKQENKFITNASKMWVQLKGMMMTGRDEKRLDNDDDDDDDVEDDEENAKLCAVDSARVRGDDAARKR